MHHACRLFRRNLINLKKLTYKQCDLTRLVCKPWRELHGASIDTFGLVKLADEGKTEIFVGCSPEASQILVGTAPYNVPVEEVA